MQPPSPYDKPENSGPNPSPYGPPPAAPPPGASNQSPYGQPPGGMPPGGSPYGQQSYNNAPGGYASGNFVPGTYPPGPAPSDISSKKTSAGILGILFPALGIHKFILGYSQEGIIMLATTVVCSVLAICTMGLTLFIPSILHIVGFIEGILYLTKSDQDFYNAYFVNKRPWF